MKLVDFIREDLVFPDLRSRRKAEVIQELAGHLANAEGLDAGKVEKVLQDRESLGSTALAEGIAVPHAKLDSIERLAGCIGRSRRGIDFGSDDGSRSHLFFVLIAPESSTGDHLKALARISRLCREPSVRERLMAAGSAAEMYAIIESEDSGSSR